MLPRVQVVLNEWPEGTTTTRLGRSGAEECDAFCCCSHRPRRRVRMLDAMAQSQVGPSCCHQRRSDGSRTLCSWCFGIFVYCTGCDSDFYGVRDKYHLPCPSVLRSYLSVPILFHDKFSIEPIYLTHFCFFVCHRSHIEQPNV